MPLEPDCKGRLVCVGVYKSVGCDAVVDYTEAML